MKDENKITKIIYDYFPRFYYFMMTSSVTSAFFWQVVLSEFTIRQDLSLYVWCDLETVSILLTRNISWLLLLWSNCRTTAYRTDRSVMLLISITQNIVFLISYSKVNLSLSHKIGPLGNNHLASYKLVWKIHVWQLVKQK